MQLKVFKYGDVYRVLILKFNSKKKETDALLSDEFINDEKLDNNLIRAKSRIKELALCNDWSHFVTLTLDRSKLDRYDLDLYINKLGDWISNYNKKYGVKMKYLLIPEQHKDGAWHMHGLFNGIAPESLVRNDNGYLDLPYYFNRFGYISLAPIRDKHRVSTYITKYVAKALQATQIKLCKHSFLCQSWLTGQRTCPRGCCFIHSTGLLPK